MASIRKLKFSLFQDFFSFGIFLFSLVLRFRGKETKDLSIQKENYSNKNESENAHENKPINNENSEEEFNDILLLHEFGDLSNDENEKNENSEEENEKSEEKGLCGEA